MNRSMICALVLGLAAGGACKKSSDQSASEKGAEGKPAATAPATNEKKGESTAATKSSAGVEAGGIAHSDTEGAAAVVAKMNGTVEVRRVGETTYAAAKADAKLYPGDVVRTSDGATATVILADQSTVELAETSTLAIATRDGTADPASAAAVLSGLARFTVTPRAPAEGPFRVYTPSAMVVAPSGTFGVGVAASGEARLGVETGTVNVVGLAQMDAKPVTVAKSMHVVFGADGNIGSPAPWVVDDWGTWRDETDAKVQLTATVDAHGKAMGQLDQQLVDGYAQLQATADQAASFEASAAASADKNDITAYQTAQVDGAATIEASFSLATYLEGLTWAYASHAQLATDIYVRHPKDVEASWQAVAPRVDAAILWPKRYSITAVAYFEPLRTQYYIHHPRGRMHASLVGIAVPEFYAKVEPAQIEPAKVRGKLKGSIVWMVPDMTYQASARPVWVTMPNASWHASAKANIAPPRANVAWYVRPPNLKAKAIVGTQVTGNWTSHLTVGAPQPYADLQAMWTAPVGTKIRVAAPDLDAAANARAKVKLGGDGRIVWDHRANAAADMKTNVKGKLDVKVPDVNVKVPDVKAKVGVTVRDHRDAAVNAGANVKGAVKANVKVPEVKVPAPSVKVEGKAKVQGGFKIGN